jgi:hypothetical protein
VKKLVFLLMVALLLSACGDNESEVTKEEPKQEETEEKEVVAKSDYEKVILDNEHPLFFSDNDSALIFAEKHPKEKVVVDIVGGKKHSKYGDKTLIMLKGFDSDGFIKGIEIYVGKTDEDLNIEEAIKLADEYTKSDLINKNYFVDESVKIFSENEDKSDYIRFTYKKNEKPVDAEDMPYTFYVIVESNNEIVDMVWITHQTPKWMNFLSKNGYESKEFHLE